MTGSRRWLRAAPTRPVPSRVRGAAWASAAVLVVGAATVAPFAAAVTPGAAPSLGTPVPCAGTQVEGVWQGFTVPTFPDGGTAPLGSAVSPGSTNLVTVWDSGSLQFTNDAGCTWKPVPANIGPGETVVTAAYAQNLMQVVTRSGVGDAATPHVYTSRDGGATYAATGGGLPVVGAPKSFATSRKSGAAYLSVVPQTTGTGAGGLPVPIGGTPTGSTGAALFTTADGGATFTATTSGGSVDGAITQIAVSDEDASTIWLLTSTGKVYGSTDRGVTPKLLNVPAGATAISVVPGRKVAAFSGGKGYVVDASGNGSSLGAPTGVTSAASRPGDPGTVLLSTGSSLLTWSLTAGTTTNVTPPGLVKGGVLGVAGDVDIRANTFVGVTAQSLLLRLVTPVVQNTNAPQGGGTAGGVAALVGAKLSPATKTVELRSGESMTLPLELDLPKSPTPIDLYFLVDTSSSGVDAINDIHASAERVVRDLLAKGVDLNVGIAAVDGVNADGSDSAEVDPLNKKGSYQRPTAYRQIARVGDPQVFLDRINQLQGTTIASGSGGQAQPQAAGIWQALTGSGIRSANGVTYDVQPGQAAGWRPGNVRHIIIDTTDAAFSNKTQNGTVKQLRGTPTVNNDGVTVDMAAIEAKLVAQNVQHVGILYSPNKDAQKDLTELSRASGAFAGPDGLSCDVKASIAPGAPLTCYGKKSTTTIVESAVESLQDLQLVGARAGAADAVLTGVALQSGSADNRLNAYLDHVGSAPQSRTNTGPVKVLASLTCPVADAASSHAEAVQATFRGDLVATAQLTVSCGGGPAPVAVAPPVIPAPAKAAVNNPAPPPAAQPPAPVPVPPAVQPAVQPQAQTQVQAQSQVNAQAAAQEEQQAQVELALAMAGVFQTDEAGPGGALAMSGVPSLHSRRDDDDKAALVSLAIGVGLTGGALALTESRRRRRDDDVTPVRASID